MRSIGLAVWLLAACHGSNAAEPADAQIDALPPPGPHTVVVTLATTAPDLFLYRDGAGPWLVPEPGSSGYVLHVTNDYEVLVVCAGPSGFDAEIQATTFAEMFPPIVTCYRKPSGPDPVAVTGQMVQPGTVWLDSTAQSTTPDWSFTLQVSPGGQNLVAYDSDHILVMRDVGIVGPTSLPSIDVVQNGVAMTPVNLTVNNIGVDAVTTELGLWFSDGSDAELRGSSTTMMTPPPSILGTGVTELLFVTATGASSRRQAATFFDGTQTTFAMMPALTGVAYSERDGTVAATWGELPAHNSLRLIVSDDAAWTRVQRISVTNGWLAATGATSLSFGPLPASYDPAWSIDLSGPYIRNFEATSFDGSTGNVLYSAVPQGMNGATPRLAGFLRRFADARDIAAAIE